MASASFIDATEDAVHSAERPAITLTVFRKDGGPLTKRLSVGEDGALVSDGSPCRMSHGTARTVSVANMDEFAELIGGLDQVEAIALGPVKQAVLDDNGCARIVRHAELAQNFVASTISRTLEFIHFPTSRPALMLVDFDTKGMSAEVLARIQAEGFDTVLGEVAPDILAASRVWRPSTSSGVRNAVTGTSYDKAGGHLYLAVADAADIPRATKVLHQRCWLAGFGHILVGRAGQLLERSIIDVAVGSPERLVFEGPPQVMEPLVQDARPSVVTRGRLLNSRAGIPDLSPSEAASLDDMLANARAEADLRAAPIRKAADQAEIGKLRAIGMPESEARERVAACHQGKLYPHVELHFDNSDVTTVADVFADPLAFHEETLADPMEPDTGRCRAKLFVNANGTVVVNTFARGGAVFKLVADRATIERAIAESEPEAAVAQVKRLIACAELSPTEVDAVVAATALRSGAGKRSVRKELDEARQVARTVSFASQPSDERAYDGRLALEAPATAGEFTPTLMAIDAKLCALNVLEPPFRLLDGRLGIVRERTPGGLHLLLTDAEAAAVDHGEDLSVIPAPAHAALFPAEYTDAALEIEQYVRLERRSKDGETYPVRIPEPHGKAYLFWKESKLPRISGIVTLPLVLPNRRVLAGRGLDAKLSVIFRIPEALHDVMPKPDEVDLEYAIDCLEFLMNEWLVDVETSPAGKAVIIAMTAQTIERHLLAERPAYSIDAGQRGGGKTTTVVMAHIAATGIRPAAASWADDENERRKALFAAFMAGTAMIPFDNISRGTQIRCSTIERSLTSPEITDRVLATSRIETVVTTATIVFTGNNITPVGDMASRTLRISLEIDRPDPENRPVKHPDPIGWTDAHRGAILNAIYSIMLVPGPRPVAVTRFKQWYHLIGAPIEIVFAAWAKRQRDGGGEAPAPFAFKDLFSGNEDEDTEAEGTRTILNALWTLFPNTSEGPLPDPACYFKGADFAAMLEFPTKPDAMTGDFAAYADERRAVQALRGALGAAVNNMQRDTITAQDAGFRLRSLVGRAVDAGGHVLTLRKRPVVDTKKKDSADYYIERKAVR